jgi:YegS/Rv2252/BmrU family lipid kinase
VAEATGFTRIVAVGGDGTINAVVNGLISAGVDVPIGVVPFGTGNEFVRALGIPRRVNQAVAVLAAGVVRRIDVGRVNGTVFLNSFGIGLDAQVADAVRTWKRRRWLRGRAIYYLAGIRALARRMRAEQVEVRAGHQRLAFKAVMVSVVNARPYLARGLADGALEDGQLDLYLVEPMKALRVLKWLVSRAGWITQPEVRSMQGARLQVVYQHPVVAHTDGSLLPPSRVYDFEVLPGRIRMLVPEDTLAALRRSHAPGSNGHTAAAAEPAHPTA